MQDLLRVMSYMFHNRHDHKVRMVRTDDPKLCGWSDSSFADCLTTARSTCGGVVKYGSMIISAYSKRSSVICRSSTEAEFYACHKVAMDCDRVKHLLQFLGTQIKSYNVYCDNKSTVAMITQHAGSRKQSRSFRLRTNDMKDLTDAKFLTVMHIPGTANPADGFTKAQDLPMFRKFTKFLYGQ